jgi:acetyl esterase/lipase
MLYGKKINLSEDGRTFMVPYILEKSPEMPLSEKRPAMVVIPGGGYQALSDREAEPIAIAFASQGFQTFVVRYSVGKYASFPNPLVDLMRAMKVVRDNAEEWFVNPDAISVVGFSAGGHLTASLGVYWNDKEILEKAGVTAEEAKPNALVLCYPVITTGEYAHRESADNVTGGDAALTELLSLEKQVTAHMPPCFLWHCIGDESVPVENSLLLATAMQRAGVDYECHLFAGGAHGISMCNQEVETPNPEATAWIDLSKTWLNKQFHYIP